MRAQAVRDHRKLSSTIEDGILLRSAYRLNKKNEPATRTPAGHGCFCRSMTNAICPKKRADVIRHRIMVDSFQFEDCLQCDIRFLLRAHLLALDHPQSDRCGIPSD